MKLRFCGMVTVVFSALAGRADAVDLATIERSVRAEPPYESKKPRYCLLVFGPEAKTRAWLVVDGDVLYLDRNGNGDLTDSGECIQAREVDRGSAERSPVKVRRVFELRGVEETILTCGPQVEWFYVHQVIPRQDHPDQDFVKRMQARPFDVAVSTKTGPAQRGFLRFAGNPQEAPILRFNGPRRFVLDDLFDRPRFRPGERCHLAVRLLARGLNATVQTGVRGVPDDVHPVADIAFPPARPGEAPIRVRTELDRRC